MKKYLILFGLLFATSVYAFPVTIDSEDLQMCLLEEENFSELNFSGSQSGLPQWRSIGGQTGIRVRRSGDIVLIGNTQLSTTSPDTQLEIHSSSTYAISASSTIQTTDLNFFDEIRPDGITCANNEILKRTGADNWDCAADDTGTGIGPAWEEIFTSDITPTSSSAGIFVRASSTIDADFRVVGSATTTATSTVRGLKVENLISCNTIDTTAEGHFICGEDTGGGGSSAWQSTTTDELGGVLPQNGSKITPTTTASSIFIELDALFGGAATTSLYHYVGTGGTVNNLNFTGGDLYVQDDFEVDGTIFTADIQATGGTITGITDLVVADGGTGFSTCTDGGVVFGSGTSPFTCSAVLSNGQLLVGDGTDDPTLATLTGTANEITVTNGAGTITLSIPDAVTLVTLTLTNDLTVANGGTGASTFTNGGILLGSGTGAFTALGVATNGQIPIGDGATDPVLANITGSLGVAVANGAGTIALSTDGTIQALEATSTTGFDTFTLTPTSTHSLVLNGNATTTGNVVVGDDGGTATTTLIIGTTDMTAKGTCLVLQDVDSASFTYVYALNGALVASTVDCT